jgi:hypothetical protein
MSDIKKNPVPITNVESDEVKNLSSGAADEALNFLRAENLPGSVIELDEKALMGKIAWMVMPYFTSTNVLSLAH